MPVGLAFILIGRGVRLMSGVRVAGVLPIDGHSSFSFRLHYRSNF